MAKQSKTFKRVLSFLKDLHCPGVRGGGGGGEQECPVEVLHTVLTHLKEHVPRPQPIHVHCFTGNQTSMESWITEFSRTYFWFPGLVRQFSEEQKKALWAIHTERILLKTDELYFGFERHSLSTPNRIGLTANAVAKVRHCTALEILNASINNGNQLYGGLLTNPI